MLKIEMIGNITNFITSHRLDCYYTLKIECIFVRMYIFLCHTYAVFSIFIAYFYFFKKGKLRASPFCHFMHFYIQFLVIFIGGFDPNLFVHKIYLVLVLVSMKIVKNFVNNIFCKNTHVLQIFFGVHILKRFVMTHERHQCIFFSSFVYILILVIFLSSSFYKLFLSRFFSSFIDFRAKIDRVSNRLTIHLSK